MTETGSVQQGTSAQKQKPSATTVLLGIIAAATLIATAALLFGLWKAGAFGPI